MLSEVLVIISLIFLLRLKAEIGVRINIQYVDSRQVVHDSIGCLQFKVFSILTTYSQQR